MDVLERISNDFVEIKMDVKDIKKILNGNGKIGIVAKVENHDVFIENSKKRQWDLSTFLFRAVIAALVTFIAYKVGISP